MKYRKDFQAVDLPTINTIARDGIDEGVARTRSYVLNIVHCRDWHPSYGERQGFMPNVSSRYGFNMSGSNGDFYPGTDDATYQRAFDAGSNMLAERQREHDARMKVNYAENKRFTILRRRRGKHRS